MINYMTAAGDAIEAVIRALDPEVPEGDDWPTITPMAGPPDGWLFELPSWMRVASMIEESFNSAIDPESVSLSDAELAQSGEEELLWFQELLADKAVEASGGRR
ncbi:hypothetical protein [Allosphingosinicella deserti]|uniref:Uncharacterized protein n=1 Tax=Allosphingosinicella deserti TaxID=2116704 RepID=A0A2P7QR71_9SPHN|nr:hypothetical protein [Sphingomonas deserti]PSJ40462.1 hypothetical protein C7I55_08990 [Sphingomonas deserti]